MRSPRIRHTVLALAASAAFPFAASDARALSPSPPSSQATSAAGASARPASSNVPQRAPGSPGNSGNSGNSGNPDANASPTSPHASMSAGPLDDDGDDGVLPEGHPNVAGNGGAQGGGGTPAGGGTGPNGIFEPPPDTEEEAMDLPPGTIVATIVNPAEKPVPNASVTIGVLNNSVAKGESRSKMVRSANAQGELRLDNLATDSHIAYRVTVPLDGATFAATPFRLPEKHGIRVKLHVYPVTHDVEQALIVTQVILYVEMKDDRVQIQEALSIWNFGATTWVPENVTLALPAGFTGFSTQQEMSDTGVDSVEKVGVKLRGTFTPGRHDVEFRWQLPYDGESSVTVDAGMPPHVAAARAMAPASRQMTFAATGFPPAVSRTDGQGQRVLVSEKQMSRGEPPLRTLHVELRDLPVQGPGRYVATSLTAVGIATGIALALQGRSARDRRSQSRKKEQKDIREELLAELVELEDAHKRGDVGPQTYARARRELIDQIALTFAPAETSGRAARPAPSAAT